MFLASVCYLLRNHFYTKALNPSIVVLQITIKHASLIYQSLEHNDNITDSINLSYSCYTSTKTEQIVRLRMMEFLSTCFSIQLETTNAFRVSRQAYKYENGSRGNFSGTSKSNNMYDANGYYTEHNISRRLSGQLKYLCVLLPPITADTVGFISPSSMSPKIDPKMALVS